MVSRSEANAQAATAPECFSLLTAKDLAQPADLAAERILREAAGSAHKPEFSPRISLLPSRRCARPVVILYNTDVMKTLHSGHLLVSVSSW